MRYLLLLIVAVAVRSEAATINASTPHRTDVATAIASAVDGDSVIVPAGTAEWTNSLVITKSIQLIGAGIGSTVILDSVVATSGSSQQAQAIIHWTTSAGKVSRLSGFEFRAGSRGNELVEGSVQFTGDGTLVRMDHCKFSLTKNRALFIRDRVYGLADHCEFEPTTQFAAFRQSNLYGRTNGDGSWENPVVPGSGDAWYVEDCIIIGKASDAFGGSRMVMRFNTGTNYAFGTHGTESSQRYRAARWLEVYGNTVHNPSTARPHFVDFRDGSGLVASNTVTGNYNNDITVNNYRAHSPFTPPGATTYWGGADGTNPWDTNDVAGGIYESGTCTSVSGGVLTMTDSGKSWTVNQWAGYTLRNMSSNYTTVQTPSSNTFSMITANTANTITFKDGFSTTKRLRFAVGNTYEIRRVIMSIDQPGSDTSDVINTASPAWLNQGRRPIYQWANTLNGVPFVIQSSFGNIVEGRDFTNNVAHPTWTPYTYPHPLIAITEGSGPDPLITVQPQSQTINSGQTATMSVTATGTGPLTYQWYQGSSPDDVNPIGGATSSSYTTPALFVTQSFWVRVTGAEGTADSTTATITIVGDFPPTITDEPDSQTIFSGQTAFMFVTASGTGDLSYQWYQGASGVTGSPITGATNSNYTTPALTSTTQYWVRVTNLVGTDDSTTATITVVPTPPQTPTPNGLGRLIQRLRRR